MKKPRFESPTIHPQLPSVAPNRGANQPLLTKIAKGHAMFWLIGASSTCDLIIDAPGVSSRHCQLTRAGDQMQLTDLDSTNGTWVNDIRIAQATAIGPDDRVRLGQQTALSWPQLEQLANSRVICIGREADNDVSLSDEKISGHHARLLVEPNRLTIIDLDSSNGTSVGSQANKVTRQVVSADDVVFFAAHQMRVRDLLTHADVTDHRQSYGVWHRACWTAVVASIVLLTGWIALQNYSTTGPVAAPITDVVADVLAPADTPERTLAEQMQQSLFAVVVKSTATEPGLRIGTAWVVGDAKLATSGNLVLFLQQSASDYPVVLVQSVQDGRQWPVTQSHVHELCRKNAERIQQLTAEIEDLRRRFAEMTGEADTATEGAADAIVPRDMDGAAVEQLAQQILELEDQWFVAVEDMIHFDVGLLETEDRLPEDSTLHVLPINTARPSRLSAATAFGAAFPHDQSIVTDAAAIPVSALPGTVEAFVTTQTDTIPRLMLKCAADQLDQNWMGAPVLNTKGQVIGLYSRPTPALSPDTPPTGEHCDVTSIVRLRDLVQKAQ